MEPRAAMSCEAAISSSPCYPSMISILIGLAVMIHNKPKYIHYHVNIDGSGSSYDQVLRGLNPSL